jgi:hypothetical protein
MESKKAIKEITFKKIEDSVHEGLNDSYVFLRDSLEFDYFPETQKLFNTMMNSINAWLIHVKEKMIDGKELEDILPPEEST